MKVYDLQVPATVKTKTRLDVFCISQILDITRSQLKTGLVSLQVNGQPAKFSQTIKPNDRIHLTWQELIPDTIEGENINLDILYEDENVTVINKKQGMVTHPGAGNWTGTLVHALLYHWESTVQDSNQRTGIVHRLDKDTSGVIITARNYQALVFLQNQFKLHKTRKIYIAILKGSPPQKKGCIESRLIRDPKNRKRFISTENIERGKHAKTAWHVLQSWGAYSLVLFKLYTGRTHQIRVHAKQLGCPILGDPIYGKKDSIFTSATLMLHAKSLTITLPVTHKKYKFTAPLPKRFKKVLKKLRDFNNV